MNAGKFITMETGKTHQFWAFNLRLKAVTSKRGPEPGTPAEPGTLAIIPAGMRGDHASVIFGNPSDITPFIKKKC